jgi:hypothetical protein
MVRPAFLLPVGLADHKIVGVTATIAVPAARL